MLRILRKCMFRPIIYSGLCHILRSEYRIETIDLRVEIYFYFQLIEILHSSNMAQIYGYRMRQQTAATAQQKTNEMNIYIERIVE